VIPLLGKNQLFLYAEATDMRRSFDGLSGMVTSVLGRDPLDGSLYIFLNKRRNRMKCLVWERNGFWIFYKRLEKGTFEIPIHMPEHSAICISYDQLILILEGIDLKSIKRRPRYNHPT
jgi:transposase